MVKRKCIVIDEWIYNLHKYIEEDIYDNKPQLTGIPLSMSKKIYESFKFYLKNSNKFKFLFDENGEIKKEYRR